jgi:hypothetical protein
MSNKQQRRRQLTIAAVTAGAVLMISPAYAFNPQPDPPAKILKGIDGGDSKFNRNNANNKGAFDRVRNRLYEDPNLKNAKNKGAIGTVTPVTSPGLLEGNSGFSTQGPSATGAPGSIGGGSGGARSSGAGIR